MMFEVDVESEEAKHKRTLSHYLEKIHASTHYHNKDIAEALGVDKSYYSRIRQQQISPLTNSIITLKRFASLNGLNILDFLAQIEEIPFETKENDWSVIIKKIMNDLGPVFRTCLIHSRLSNLIKNEPKYKEVSTKIFLCTILLVDISKQDKFLSLCLDIILKIHDTMGFEKEKYLEKIILFVKSNSKKTIYNKTES